MLFFLLPLFGAIKSESYPQKLSDEEERLYLERYAATKDETEIGRASCRERV